MSNKLYPNKQVLIKAIKKYLLEEEQPTPRHFRAIGLSITKQNLSMWKKTHPEYYDLIKGAEDLILAKMEQIFSYGGKQSYNIALTLRAYDKELYAPELRNDNNQEQKAIQFVMPKTNSKKGVQSVRAIKAIKK